MAAKLENKLFASNFNQTLTERFWMVVRDRISCCYALDSVNSCEKSTLANTGICLDVGTRYSYLELIVYSEINVGLTDVYAVRHMIQSDRSKWLSRSWPDRSSRRFMLNELTVRYECWNICVMKTWAMFFYSWNLCKFMQHYFSMMTLFYYDDTVIFSDMIRGLHLLFEPLELKKL